ncbi:hypothetical protein [Hydrogenophaga sp.]|nr:hypothetical protein [Hydrogenophaga sp.]
MDFRLTADPGRGESFGRQASTAKYFTGEDALGRKKIDRHTTGMSP